MVAALLMRGRPLLAIRASRVATAIEWAVVVVPLVFLVIGLLLPK